MKRISGDEQVIPLLAQSDDLRDEWKQVLRLVYQRPRPTHRRLSGSTGTDGTEEKRNSLLWDSEEESTDLLMNEFMDAIDDFQLQSMDEAINEDQEVVMERFATKPKLEMTTCPVNCKLEQ